jgi:AraC-like DNA-binding protein
MGARIYREYPPPRGLAGKVACLWSLSVGDEGFLHRVDPDGCSDIVVFDDQPAMAVGPATAPAVIDLSPGGNIVGARFHPGMAPAGFGMPAAELVDVDTTLGDVWKPSAARELDAKLVEALTVNEKLIVLGRELGRRFAGERMTDERVAAAVRAIAGNPSGRISDLGEPFGLGSRQMLRRFTAGVGYGPKALQRVLRYQRLLVIADARPIATLGELAFAAGYVDQAHMNREVLSLSGEKPSVSLRNWWISPSMSDFFKTAERAAP